MNRLPVSPFRRRACLSALSALALAASALRAQTASPSANSAVSDSVVQLSAFEVSADKDRGYVASESITGTRVATKIRDLPFLVDVVTSDFMQDFAAFDMSQQLGWVANVSPSDSSGSLVLRGFSSTPFVDGFRRLGPLDLVDTARVEIIKGPAASIYGQTLPGGVVNYTSKRPETKPHAYFSLTVGNERMIRAEASTTGPVGNSKKLFYMVNLSASSRNFEQQWADQRRKNGSLQFMYKVDPDTTFYVKFTGQSNRNRDRTALPWIKSSTAGFLTNNNGQLGINADGTPLKYTYTSISGYNATTGVYTTKSNTANLPLPQVLVKYNINQADIDAYNAYIADPTKWGTPLALSTQLFTTNSWDRLATQYPNLHTNGPFSYNNNDLWSADFGGERRWNEHVSTKFTFDAFDSPSEDQTVSGNQMYFTDPNYPDGNVGASTPTWRKRSSKGYSSQLDDLFSFKTGPLEHKYLVTFDFTHKEDRDYRITTDTANSAAYWGLSSGSDPRAKYLIKDPSGLTYPLTLPLGPRSTGTYLWNSSTLTYSQGQQVLDWPWDTNSYWYPTYNQYPNLYTKSTTNTLGASDDYGLFMSERASAFSGRLVGLIGGRLDRMNNTFKNYLASDPTQQRSKWSNSAKTYQMGLTAYATRNIIFFANKSSAYNPNMQVVSKRSSTPVYDAQGNQTGETNVSFTSVVLPNERGDGYEYGTRFVMFDQRLNISLSRFLINRYNKVDSYTNEYGISESVGSGAQRSKGYEVDANWSATSALQVMLSYGYNETRYTQNTLAYLVGSPTPQNAKNNYSVALRYDINNGRLKGLRFIAGMRYYDRSLINVGSGGLVTLNPFATGSYKPMIRNTPLSTGVLPFPDLPAGLMILSRNDPTAGNDPGGALNPSNGKVLTNNNVNKGFVEGVNVPAGWVKYTGQTMQSGTTYYVMDGDGVNASSYTRKTNIDDNRSNVFNSPYALFNFGMSYSIKQTRRVSHTVRFNINNLFDRFYTYGNGVLGYGREYTVAYSIDFR